MSHYALCSKVDFEVATIMSASKYDWAQLKIEFLASEYHDVALWARNTTSTLPVLNGANFKHHTKGWRSEKHVFREKKAVLTIRKVLETQAEANALAFASLLKVIQAKANKASLLPMREIKDLWAILRVENSLSARSGEDIEKIQSARLRRDRETTVLKQLILKAQEKMK